MKLLSPSSSASSSSLSSCAIATSSASYEGATRSCLAGVLRRIFRSNTLPTFPVEYEKEKVAAFNSKEEEYDVEAATSVPGIVARLMGLETLPETAIIRAEKSPNSVSRSWSMNDMDYREQGCDEDGDCRSRVKSTWSFREVPTYLEIENDEFLVLSFQNITGKEEHNCGSGSRQKKGRRRRRRRNRASKCITKESIPSCENSADEQNPGGQSAEASGLAKLRNVKSDQKQDSVGKQMEIECSSENSSSPVSVLDFSEFTPSDPEASTSDECTTEDSDALMKRTNCNLLDEQSSRPGFALRRDDLLKQSYSEMWAEVCRINRREIMSDKSMWKYEDSTNICAELGGQITDELIDDLIVQLSCMSLSSINLRLQE